MCVQSLGSLFVNIFITVPAEKSFLLGIEDSYPLLSSGLSSSMLHSLPSASFIVNPGILNRYSQSVLSRKSRASSSSLVAMLITFNGQF